MGVGLYMAELYLGWLILGERSSLKDRPSLRYSQAIANRHSLFSPFARRRDATPRLGKAFMPKGQAPAFWAKVRFLKRMSVEVPIVNEKTTEHFPDHFSC